MIRGWPLLLLLPVPALAGLPGEGEAVTTVVGAAIADPDARSPLGLGAEIRLAVPLSDHEAVPDLELRAGAIHTRLPPSDLESFFLETAPGDTSGVDALAWSRWESRLQLMGSWGATSREAGPRVRAGAVALIDGTAGQSSTLEPIGWYPDYTASLRLGPTAAVGLAVPLGEAVTDPLLDVRLGGSWLPPVSAGGGSLADGDDIRDLVLTVDDQRFGPAGLVGRESRAWVEGTLVWDGFTAGAEVGLEHTAHSAVGRARELSAPDVSELAPERVDVHARIVIGWTF